MREKINITLKADFFIGEGEIDENSSNKLDRMFDRGAGLSEDILTDWIDELIHWRNKARAEIAGQHARWQYDESVKIDPSMALAFPSLVQACGALKACCDLTVSDLEILLWSFDFGFGDDLPGFSCFSDRWNSLPYAERFTLEKIFDPAKAKTMGEAKEGLLLRFPNRPRQKPPNSEKEPA